MKDMFKFTLMRKSLKIGSYFGIIRILSARQCFLSCFVKRLLPCKFIQNIFSIIVFITSKSVVKDMNGLLDFFIIQDL